MRSVIALIAIILAGLQTEAPVVDLTGVVPRSRLREPATTSASGGGVGGNGPVAQQRVSLDLTILTLESDRSAPEPSLVFEVRLTNVGQQSLELPIDPNLADFEPESASMPYAYVSAHIYVVLDLKQQSSAILPGVLLYGSRRVAESLKLLGPGESIQIRARTSLKPVNSKGASKIPTNLRAKVDLLLQQRSVRQNNGALHEDSKQIPIQTASNFVNVSLVP